MLPIVRLLISAPQRSQSGPERTRRVVARGVRKRNAPTLLGHVCCTLADDACTQHGHAVQMCKPRHELLCALTTAAPTESVLAMCHDAATCPSS